MKITSRKTIAMLSAGILTLSCIPAEMFPVSATSAVTENTLQLGAPVTIDNNLVCEVLEQKEDETFLLKITDVKDTTITSLTFPEEYDGYPVQFVELGDSVFKNCTNLTEITLPDEISAIPQQAFYGCTSLTTVHASNVTEIESEAFCNCTSLTTLNVSENVVKMGEDALYHTAIFNEQYDEDGNEAVIKYFNNWVIGVKSNLSENEKDIVIQEGTSEGTQVKYKKDGYWYKKDNRGNEGRAEYLVSKFMQFTTLQENEFISYEEGTINGKSGCRSKNFLDEEEELVTFYRLYYNEVGKDLSKVIANMNTMEERIEYVIRFIDQSCGLNIHAYLSKVLTLDMICLNEDRHLNNLALIMRGNDFYPAPIFDNGVSLLTANQSVNWNFSIEENVKRVIARPFCGSHEKMVKYLGSGFSIDVKSALSWLETEPDSIERNVLRYQINRYNNQLDLF